MSWVGCTCELHSPDVQIVLISHSWEFFSNLGYDYSLLTGKRKFTWTFPVVRSPLACITGLKDLVGVPSFIWDVVGALC
jgi:hypothetical protein